MNYENLKDAIIAVIKQNGNEEITGNILQQVLVAMVNSLGSGYQFRGIATPETNPGTPDQRVFYLASATGTYSDFGFIVSDEICALVYDTAWHKQTIIALDQEPTEDSGNLISSGAIYTALQNLADVYMKLVEDADEDHIATFGENGQVKDSGLSLDDVAKAKGSFPELFVGFAGNLVDTRSAGTPQGPYAFRQSGGDGVDYMVRIKGKTEAFNQLVGDNDTEVTVPSGHQYFAIIGGTASVATSDGSPISVTGGVDIVVDLTLEGLGLTTAAAFRALHPLPYYNYNAGVLKNNAATGIKTRGFNQWDEEWEQGGININTGQNVTSSVDMRSKNYIPVVHGGTYYFRGPASSLVLLGYDVNKQFIGTYFSGSWGIGIGASWADGQTITLPPAIAYLRFRSGAPYGTTYNHDICINLSDPSRNGTYEPYWERTLALGLNSIPCHDEDNNAVVVNGLDGVGSSYDEAVVENGMVTKIIKRRGRRAYQAGDESDATLITDGTNTDYPLATPLTLTVDTPFPAFVEVDNLGTEKRLPEDTADNPQGPFESDSNYSISTANLVRKLSEL